MLYEGFSDEDEYWRKPAVMARWHLALATYNALQATDRFRAGELRMVFEDLEEGDHVAVLHFALSETRKALEPWNGPVFARPDFCRPDLAQVCVETARVVATGLADLKKAALTHGGFYKHFDSKDQLVAEATAEALGRLTEAGPGAVGEYLSDWHWDHPGEGCPLSAIGSELARTDDSTRAVATAGFREFVDLIASGSGTLPPAAARARASRRLDHGSAR